MDLYRASSTFIGQDKRIFWALNQNRKYSLIRRLYHLLWVLKITVVTVVMKMMIHTSEQNNLLRSLLMPRSHIHGSPRRFSYGLNLTDDPGNANFHSPIRMHYIWMIKYYYVWLGMRYGKPRINTDCHEWCRIVSVANPASSPWMCDLGIKSQYRFTVRLKWVKSTVSVESRVFGLNLWGGGKYFRMFSYS